MPRLDNHNSNKNFWNQVIVFTSKDENLNKAHIRHLESRVIALANTAKRSEVENGNRGATAPRLSEPDEAEAVLANMVLIYPVLGLQAFEKLAERPSATTRLYLKGKNTQAEGFESADGSVVYAGSKARAEEVESIHEYGSRLRQSLQDEGSGSPTASISSSPRTTPSPRHPKRHDRPSVARPTAASSGSPPTAGH